MKHRIWLNLIMNGWLLLSCSINQEEYHAPCHNCRCTRIILFEFDWHCVPKCNNMYLYAHTYLVVATINLFNLFLIFMWFGRNQRLSFFISFRFSFQGQEATLSYYHSHVKLPGKKSSFNPSYNRIINRLPISITIA